VVFLVVGSHGVPFGWESGEELEPKNVLFVEISEAIGGVVCAFA
jgi:hypothetical protein